RTGRIGSSAGKYARTVASRKPSPLPGHGMVQSLNCRIFRSVSVKPLPLLLLAGLVTISGCNSNSAASPDVVARVDGKDITVAQLEKQFQNRVNGAEQAPSPDEA